VSMAERIERAGLRLGALMDDLLDLSKIERGELEVLRLRAVRVSQVFHDSQTTALIQFCWQIITTSRGSSSRTLAIVR